MENFKIFLLVPNTVYSRALLASLLSKLLLKSRALIELFFLSFNGFYVYSCYHKI